MALEAKSIGQQRATLAGEARLEIERMIIEGHLAAGEKLNELALSTAMGVSRGTVREAIRSLADSGLIDLIANRGAFVHETTIAEVRNLYDLRGAIFAMACASAARRVGAGMEGDLVQRLERNMDRMRRAHVEDDADGYYALNIEFHDILMQAAANPKGKTIYDNLVKEMHLFRRRGLSIATNIARSIEEHEAILLGVAAGGPEQARQAAEVHIRSGLARYMNIVEAD
ncbi:GntR family transcriptional regulator [Rubrimonas cliftonensis]|uniref:Transcriptional regulator, GntR family n=1 Tax=Rubrimonas cliftonensis TaxID=89524 RepID=A0A1H3XBG4_9RHOB|nr:GntR family transcriptional regulator [Rubrimonas cliftonensis]SDZ96281.1 transcriptional regulator, GntR family [Rubrimonas cliftonensis]